MGSQATERIGVYGAAGHTAKLVIADLLARGLVPVLGGRNSSKLERVARQFNRAEVKVAEIDQGGALREFLEGCAAVVNCAGPFQATAMPLASAAVELGLHYIDFTTDALVVNALRQCLHERATMKKLIVAPAVGFYGTLAELMVRAIAPSVAVADDVLIAYSVKGWKPTAGSLNTMTEFSGRRGVHCGGRFEIRTGEPRLGTFAFPEPVGLAPVMLDYPASEAVTIPRYISTPSVRVMMTVETLKDLRSAPSPDSVSDVERAGTDYILVTEVHARGMKRQATLRGSDIYGITAPIIGECITWMLAERARAHGVVSPAEAFDAPDLLRQLGRHGVSVAFN